MVQAGLVCDSDRLFVVENGGSKVLVLGTSFVKVANRNSLGLNVISIVL